LLPETEWRLEAGGWSRRMSGYLRPSNAAGKRLERKAERERREVGRVRRARRQGRTITWER